MTTLIGKFIEGISLNQLEYLLEDDGKVVWRCIHYKICSDNSPRSEGSILVKRITNSEDTPRRKENLK